MMKSLKYGDASIVLPIQQMSFLATFFLGVIFLKEKVSGRRIAALVCGVVALLLLSWPKSEAAGSPAPDSAQIPHAEVLK